MPRVKRHAKIHCSIGNHQKTADVYASNDLFSMYVRLLLLATERFADRHDDSFTIHESELRRITGKGRADVARKSLGQLADNSPITAERDGNIWRIGVPNFAKKQGFGLRNGAETANPSSPPSTSSPSCTALRDAAGAAPSDGQKAPPEKAKKSKAERSTRAPERLTDEQLSRVTAWVELKHPWLEGQPKRQADLIDACLDHHRAKGSTSTDWVLNVRNWIRNEVKFGRAGGPGPGRNGGGGVGLAAALNTILKEAEQDELGEF